MDNFTFYSPTYFVFGKEEENNAGKYVQRFGGKKVLIHYGGGSAVRSGLLDRVKKSLTQAGLEYVELGGVKPNPRSGLVYEGIGLCRKEKVDFILAVGGGSTIDSAKAIAIGVPYEGDFWDFYQGKAAAEALPIGTVLTIAAAGSEGGNGSVITHEEGNYKRATGSEVLYPKFSILNPALTQTLPAYQTACGITDIMAHLLERYFTNTKEVEVTDRLLEALLLTMIKEGPKAIENPNDYGARANIMWAGMMAHNDSCGVGRSQDWASHEIEHELSGAYDCAHGAGLAVVMPAVMKYNMYRDVNRFARLAVNVWGCQMNFDHPEETAKEGIEAFQHFLAKIHMPSNLEDLGAREEDIEMLAHNCSYGAGRTGILNGFAALTEQDIINIYHLMG
ncbi:iron-containing alcohol dehydrogenase [Bariatricus sp. SGI.154]|uniref:iron-containing alcohol dehydrogenase n=1 Tax=Bariatricus sp. SGI.154 TaxID=3420549 RepID=UPI003CFDC714